MVVFVNLLITYIEILEQFGWALSLICSIAIGKYILLMQCGILLGKSYTFYSVQYTFTQGI